MRASGIIRRLDDLGRICIPKAVRQAAFGTSNTEGMPIEFFYEKDGTVILKPYKIEEVTYTRCECESEKQTFKISKDFCKEYKYNPEKIGCEVLRKLGYQVTEYFYSDSAPTVRDKDGKFLY